MSNSNYIILIADDEVELTEALALYFKIEPNLTLLQAADGKEALDLFHSRHIDLVILDIMMPELNGFDVLKEIRKTSRIPAIMLTARDDPNDKVQGLSLGADDYITKPFDPREVLARVKAQLRRSYSYSEKMQSEKDTAIIKHGSFSLDTEKMELRRNGEVIPLSGTEFRIMKLLMSSPSKIYTKRQIYEAAWSDNYVSDDNTIMVRISGIRRKIHDDSKHPKTIINVKGLGYKFEADHE